MAKISLSEALSIDDVDLVMFDKDGTLFDIHFYWCSIIKLRAKKLSSLFFSNMSNCEEHTRELESIMGVDEGFMLKREGPVGIKPRGFIIKVVQAYISKLCVVSELEVSEAFEDVDLESSLEIGNYLNLLPGVESLLKSLKQSGVKLAIATTDIQSRAELALKSKGLDGYFDLVVGGDCVKESKPSGEMGTLICETLRVDKLKSVMVGDHSVDLRMAQNAHLRAGLGVLTGLGSRKSLLRESKYIVDTLESVRVL